MHSDTYMHAYARHGAALLLCPQVEDLGGGVSGLDIGGGETFDVGGESDSRRQQQNSSREDPGESPYDRDHHRRHEQPYGDGRGEYGERGRRGEQGRGYSDDGGGRYRGGGGYGDDDEEVMVGNSAKRVSFVGFARGDFPWKRETNDGRYILLEDRRRGRASETNAIKGGGGSSSRAGRIVSGTLAALQLQLGVFPACLLLQHCVRIPRNLPLRARGTGEVRLG